MSHPSAEDLTRIPLFSALSTDERRAIAERMDVSEFDTGSRLVTEGRHGYVFYVLERGRAVVTQGDRELRTLGPGDFFGEIALLSDSRRTATVTATEPCVAWALFGTSFRQLESMHPEVTAALESVLRGRLAHG